MSEAVQKSPIKVLLVEDDRDDFYLTQDMLSSVSRQSYAVVWAGSYETAQNALYDQRFDVALVDYHIGDRTGLDFISEVGSKHPECPMILLTGVDNPEVDRAAEQAGAADFLVKDALNPDLLDRAIRYARKHAERNALLGAIIANADVGMVALSADGLPLVWNREVLRALGIRDQTGSVGSRDVAQAIVKLSKEGSLPQEFVTSAAETFEARCNDVPNGKVIVFQDVTRRVRNERLLRQTVLDAEAASRAKSSFLATMSHELRTPLNGILGMVRVLESTTADAAQVEYLGTIKSSSMSLLAIINDVLDLSKIEAGKFELDDVEFDLPHMLEEVVSLLAPTAFAKGVDLAALIAADVPRKLRGDPVRLRQVVTNLVGNAVKFTTEGSVALVARRDASDARRPLSIEVVDTGIGIAQEDQAKLFEKFSQVDSSLSRRNGGTGLGLALCRQIVGLMRGQIWCESTPGQGSTFGIKLPQPMESAMVAAAALNKRNALGGAEIALLSSSDAAAEFFKFHLSETDSKLSIFEQDEALLSAIQATRFDALILDRFGGAVPSVALQRIVRTPQTAAGVTLFSLVGDQLDTGVPGFETLPRPLTTRTIDQLVSSLAKRSRPVATPHAKPAAPHWSKALKILIAEDNEPNQRVARALLKSAGYDPVIVDNGQLAVEAALATRFDVVLMDVQMPVMDGLEATRRLRAQEATRHIPIIGLTANAMNMHRQECIAAGMSEFLPKPVDWDAVFALLARLNREIYGAPNAA